MNLKKTFHHEEHEDFSYGCMLFGAHPQGAWHSRNSLPLFFAFFVPFVVHLPFLR
jgi:hypothetical protein